MAAAETEEDDAVDEDAEDDSADEGEEDKSEPSSRSHSRVSRRCCSRPHHSSSSPTRRLTTSGEQPAASGWPRAHGSNWTSGLYSELNALRQTVHSREAELLRVLEEQQETLRKVTSLLQSFVRDKNEPKLSHRRQLPTPTASTEDAAPWCQPPGHSLTRDTSRSASPDRQADPATETWWTHCTPSQPQEAEALPSKLASDAQNRKTEWLPEDYRSKGDDAEHTWREQRAVHQLRRGHKSVSGKDGNKKVPNIGASDGADRAQTGIASPPDAGDWGNSETDVDKEKIVRAMKAVVDSSVRSKEGPKKSLGTLLVSADASRIASCLQRRSKRARRDDLSPFGGLCSRPLPYTVASIHT